MKSIIDSCCIIAFGIAFSIALFGINGSLTETNKHLKQISTDVQDLTSVQQTEKYMACYKEMTKNTNDIKKWSKAITECRDLYKTKSQKKADFEAEEKWEKVIAEDPEAEEWAKRFVESIKREREANEQKIKKR